MLRRAIAGDLPRLYGIRDSAAEDALSDPSVLTEPLLARLLEHGWVSVSEEPDGRIAGFAAADPRDGRICALLVAPGHEGEGIGRALLAASCEALRTAGHRVATLSLPAGSRAERHYRAAGWTALGDDANGGRVFRKAL
jgi:GNAT superfamily N-acetyltransferase